jgi:hypothetical protein
MRLGPKFRAILTVGFCLLLLLNESGWTSSVRASQSSLSGNFVFSYVDDSSGTNIGNGTFTVLYDFPSALTLGSNLTGQVSLQINDLNGLQTYVEEYQIAVSVVVPGGGGTSGMVSGTSPLHPGSIWGPETLAIPITQEDVGGIPGPVNATVSINLATTVLAQAQLNVGGAYERFHGDDQVIGNLTIGTGSASKTTSEGNNGSINSRSGVGLLPYVIVVGGVVLVSLGIALPRLYPEKDTEKK